MLNNFILPHNSVVIVNAIVGMKIIAKKSSDMLGNNGCKNNIFLTSSSNTIYLKREMIHDATLVHDYEHESV